PNVSNRKIAWPSSEPAARTGSGFTGSGWGEVAETDPETANAMVRMKTIEAAAMSRMILVTPGNKSDEDQKRDGISVAVRSRRCARAPARRRDRSGDDRNGK